LHHNATLEARREEIWQEKQWEQGYLLRKLAVNATASATPDKAMHLNNHLSMFNNNEADNSGRRSSTYTAGRPSSIGFLSQTSSQIQKDPRPLRDKTFMANCQRNILDYLISANYPIPISIKTLQVPTSKDFANIFKFLYNRMDPNYQFVKKIEDEVISCLKALKYLHRSVALM
jgi:SMC interacting uncharacterized protein involved in chromosome segregation